MESSNTIKVETKEVVEFIDFTINNIYKQSLLYGSGWVNTSLNIAIDLVDERGESSKLGYLVKEDKS